MVLPDDPDHGDIGLAGQVDGVDDVRHAVYGPVHAEGAIWHHKIRLQPSIGLFTTGILTAAPCLTARLFIAGWTLRTVCGSSSDHLHVDHEKGRPVRVRHLI
jgi:hypothetical protein